MYTPTYPEIGIMGANIEHSRSVGRAVPHYFQSGSASIRWDFLFRVAAGHHWKRLTEFEETNAETKRAGEVLYMRIVTVKTCAGNPTTRLFSSILSLEALGQRLLRHITKS